MHTLHTLCEFGLGIKLARDLFDAGIYLEDIMENGRDIFKGKEITRADSVYSLILKIGFDKLLYDSIFVLSSFGLSNCIVEKCFQNNLLLDDLDNPDYIKLHNTFGVNTSNKIIEAYKKFKATKLDTKVFFIDTISYIKYDAVLVRDALEYFSKIKAYPINHFEDDLKSAVDAGVIEIVSDKIVYKYPSLANALEQLPPKSKWLIDEKLKGRTLEDIGKELMQTRESVRQKLENAFELLPVLYEDKYKDIITKYRWDFDSMKFFYGIDQMTFRYLKCRYGLGEVGLHVLLSENISDDQRDYLYYHNNLIDANDDILYNQKSIILKYVLSKYAVNEITYNELFVRLVDFMTQIGHTNYYWSKVESFKNYLDSFPFAIHGNNLTVRFWDFKRLLDSDLYCLTSLIHLPIGIYNTRMLFDNNKEMMDRYDIRDEFELHNILRRINNDEHVTFKKMPYLIIGNVSREEFTYMMIEKMAPVSINDFMEHIHCFYGKAAPLMESNCLRLYKDKRSEELLKGTSAVDESIFDEMRKNLREDIIPIYIYDKRLKSKRSDYREGLLSTRFVDENGYYFYPGGFLVRKSISDPIEHLKQKIMLKKDHKIISKDSIYLTPLYFKALYYLSEEKKMVCFGNSFVYKKEYLESIGITEELMNDYVNQALLYANNHDLFTSDTFNNYLSSHELVKKGLPSICYDSILIKSRKFLSMRYLKICVFTLNDKIKSPIDYSRIIFNVISNFGCENLFNYLRDTYDIYISKDQIKMALFEKSFLSEVFSKF